APDARTVRPLVVPVAIVEQLHPGGTAAVLQGLDVVHDLQQPVTLGAAVNRTSDRPRPFAAIETAEFRGVRHGGTIAAPPPGTSPTEGPKFRGQGRPRVLLARC